MRNYTSKNPLGSSPPSFDSLYKQILTDPKNFKVTISASTLYSPEYFAHFGEKIWKDPDEIPQAMKEIEEYASKVGKLISKNTVELEGEAFETFHEFANALKFYNENIGDIKEMVNRYKEGDSTNGISTITNSLSNIKFLMTHLEEHVKDFLKENKKYKKRLKP
ncbi:MAG: hypothetical protein JSV39_00405 [Candidatus Aenigmatarchaeota archaeon]|nr:MAG: hypothetical protein JSV39_00405 [Candidatus Aenigmarchaeota archaeon]